MHQIKKEHRWSGAKYYIYFDTKFRDGSAGNCDTRHVTQQ